MLSRGRARWGPLSPLAMGRRTHNSPPPSANSRNMPALPPSASHAHHLANPRRHDWRRCRCHHHPPPSTRPFYLQPVSSATPSPFPRTTPPVATHAVTVTICQTTQPSGGATYGSNAAVAAAAERRKTRFRLAKRSCLPAAFPRDAHQARIPSEVAALSMHETPPGCCQPVSAKGTRPCRDPRLMAHARLAQARHSQSKLKTAEPPAADVRSARARQTSSPPAAAAENTTAPRHRKRPPSLPSPPSSPPPSLPSRHRRRRSHCRHRRVVLILPPDVSHHRCRRRCSHGRDVIALGRDRRRRWGRGAIARGRCPPQPRRPPSPPQRAGRLRLCFFRYSPRPRGRQPPHLLLRTTAFATTAG